MIGKKWKRRKRKKAAKPKNKAKKPKNKALVVPERTIEWIQVLGPPPVRKRLRNCVRNRLRNVEQTIGEHTSMQ